MTRRVEHEPVGKRRCSCGANFKTKQKRDHHIREQTQPSDRVVWINTLDPHSMAQRRHMGRKRQR